MHAVNAYFCVFLGSPRIYLYLVPCTLVLFSIGNFLFGTGVEHRFAHSVFPYLLLFVRFESLVCKWYRYKVANNKVPNNKVPIHKLSNLQSF